MSDIIIFDTSVLVDHLRTGRYRHRIDQIEGLLRNSSVVLAELWRGAITRADREFLRAFEKNHPSLTPTQANWIQSGHILARLRTERNYDAGKLRDLHFDVLIALLEKNKGTLVKTIGDAVMAVFADDMDGLVASVAILHAFERFRREHPDRERTHIKLGVFGGPCYVVTANGILDYFGQTVNLSARLQGEAKSGELVVVEALADRAVAEKALPEAFVVERYDARLKGVDGAMRVARIRLPARDG